MTTERMKAAVVFCEDYGFPKYQGNINNFNNVSSYLSQYLNKAKQRFREEQQRDEEEFWELFESECGGLGLDDIY